MNINDSFPSRWLKSADIQDDQDMILTIKIVDTETVGQGEDAEEKPVIYFNETDKGLVLNKTNAATISALYTPETDNWSGKKISLFATEVQFGSKMTVALRVRTKPPKAASNGGIPTHSNALWIRYAAVADQATALGLEFGDLDQAASDADVKAAGIALKAKVDAALAF